MIYTIFILFTLLILLLALYEWQYLMIFTPTYHRDGLLASDCTLLSITTEDNIALEGVLYEPKEPQATLLFFAGRSHDVVGVISKLKEAYPHFRILSFNYRSYGESQGKAGEKALLNDAKKIATMVEKHYGEYSVLGFSLGSNIAAYLASTQRVKALFLIGAFDSIASLAYEKYAGVMPLSIGGLSKILRYKFPTDSYVRGVEAPTYLFASRADEISYIQNGRKLKEEIKNLLYYEEFEALSHKELLWDKRVIKRVTEALC